MKPETTCPYCCLTEIIGYHKPEDHLNATVNLIDLPLYIVEQLKQYFVRIQKFEDAAKCRAVEKIIIEANKAIGPKE